MKKNKKQLVFAILALGFGIASINIQLSEGTTTSIVKAAETDFIISDEGVLTEYKGTDENIVIPDSVKEIGDYVFSGCNLTAVTIPNSVEIIGEGAFQDCSSLTDIKIPDSVTTIGYGAFIGCESLISIEIPNSVTAIPEWAFWNCLNLTNVSIPDSVITIGENAFGDCNSLTSITVPKSVTEIGAVAFSRCPALEEITVESDNKIYESRKGVLYKKEKSGLSLITYPAKKSGKKYTIPKKTINIESLAFNNCSNLTNITIQNNVTSIGSNAFYGCSKLTSITIPESVTSLEYIYGSFWGCDSLKDLKISIINGKKVSVDIALGEGSDLYKPTMTSQNKKIATISKKGVITAKKKGTATIVFKRTTRNGKTVKATLTVTVK